VSTHAALLRSGAGWQTLSFSPPRRRNSDGSFQRDDSQPGPNNWSWNLTAMEDLEVRVCDLGDFRLSDRPMEGNPATQRWNLFCAGHAHMPDGRLFVAGGHIAGLSQNASRLHVYDPGAGAAAWTRAGGRDMRVSRWYPTVTPLPDGRMLITSGSGQAVSGTFFDDLFTGYWGQIHNDYEIFDPATGRLAETEREDLIDMSRLSGGDRLATYPAVFALPGGRAHPDGVIVVIETNRAWLYAYEPRRFPRRPLRRAARVYRMATQGSRSYPHYGSAVVLPFSEGDRRIRILVVGGQSTTNTNRRDLNADSPATATAEIFEYDTTRPLTDQPGWRRAGSMVEPRILCDATLLADGKVLVSGGARRGWTNRNGDPVFRAELFHPATERFGRAAFAQLDRRYHSTALLLPDGTVLKAGSHGGFDPDPTWIRPQFVAERFIPPYRLGVSPPRITGGIGRSGVLRYGHVVKVAVTGKDLAKARVALVRCGSVTHGFDMDQRYVRLRVRSRRADAGRATVVAEVPADAAAAPRGDYLLFVVPDRGIPSDGRFIRLAR
jgi:hypothetical protein